MVLEGLEVLSIKIMTTLSSAPEKGVEKQAKERNCMKNATAFKLNVYRLAWQRNNSVLGRRTEIQRNVEQY